MRVLITGANGFIGSYLANYLSVNGYEVVASSRQFHPSTQKLLGATEFVELDVLDQGQLEGLSLQADMIVHTATANDIVSRQTLKGIELSAIGTKNILDFAMRNGIARCIVFSTLQVYGTELTGSIDENSPLKYQNDYALNHLFGEMYAELYTRQHKVQCVSVRPSNVYGRILSDAFNRWSLVPGCFCKEAHETGTITIKSSGKQLRNFVNLENLCRGLACIIQHFPGNYECYNLASSQSHTMIETAGKVAAVYEKMYKKPLKLNVIGTEPADTNQFAISLDKLTKIGFTEDGDYTLETEIEQLFNYLKSK